MRRPEEGLEQEPLANFVNGGNLAPTIKEGHNPMRCCGNGIKSAEAKNGPRAEPMRQQPPNHAAPIHEVRGGKSRREQKGRQPTEGFEPPTLCLLSICSTN